MVLTLPQFLEPRPGLATQMSQLLSRTTHLKYTETRFILDCWYVLGFAGGSVVKNLPANAGDKGSIPGSGRFRGEGNGNPSSILAWKIPWTEEPGGPQSIGLKRVRHNLVSKQQQKD